MDWSKHAKHAAFGIGLAAIAAGLSWLVAEPPQLFFEPAFATISGLIFGWMIARMWDVQSPRKHRSLLFVDYPDGRIAYYPTGGRHGYWIDARQEQSLRARSRLVGTVIALILVANIALLPGTSRLADVIPRGFEIAFPFFGMLPAFVIVVLWRLRARRPLAGLQPAPGRSHREVRKLRANATPLWSSIAAFASCLVLTIALGVVLVILAGHTHPNFDLVIFWGMFVSFVLLTAWSAGLLVRNLIAKRG